MIKKGVQLELNEKYIRWFSALGKEDVKDVGGKAANLGEMFNLGLPVPQGFAILASGYSYFLDETNLKNKIYKLLEINVEKTEELDEATEKIREMIVNAEMPKDLKEEIIEAYSNLSVDRSMIEKATANVLAILKTSDPMFVAVRSSATAEDSSEASFAGQQETFLNIKGKENVIEAVKKCWASLFTARSVYYRIKKGFKHENVLIAVVVQEMINSDKSGVIFSRDPVASQDNIVVEAVFGLGEGIVSGKIEPDHYIVDRELKIVNKRIAEKKIALVRDSAGKTQVAKLTEEKSNQQVLSDYEIKKLADYSMKLEEHYKKPQDIEFAVSSGEIHIVQTRPITTLENKTDRQEISGTELVSGQPASPGIGSGEVKIIRELKDLTKVKKGDVLVAEMTNPDMVVAMQKSSAIVTDEGGSTSHAAIVSREMGIPCIVGTKKATKILKDGMIITVDGFSGKVYEGHIDKLKDKKVEIKPIVETRTKIKMIVDLPDFAERAALTHSKAVGLTRLEGIIAESGKHPFYFLKQNEIEHYEDVIFKGVSKIAEHFEELWIRTSDIRSDEFKHLKGAPQTLELNPMMGMHGIRAGLKYPEILKAEIKALARIKNKKVGIMMPQVISVEEVQAVKKLIHELGAEHLILGIMVETPAAVQIIESLCLEGIHFISFGTNDLTQFTLAVDRGNEDCQYLYNEMHPAVLAELAHVISVCKKHNVETSICGQAASTKPMVEFLVKQGISSLSVNADKAFEISEFVRDLENNGKRGSNYDDLDGRELLKQEIDSKSKTGEIQTETRRVEKTKDKYRVNCSNCGTETSVPFKPDGVRPVYCKICLEAEKQKKLFKKEETKDEIEIETKEEIKEELEAENRMERRLERKEEKKKESFYEPVSEEIIEGKEEEKKEDEDKEEDIGLDVIEDSEAEEEDAREGLMNKRGEVFLDIF